jgi:hypothetical protein
MEWLNIHTATLDSEAVIGADPIERGTWLMLLRFCIGQENGGIVLDAKNWKDRKCQQLLRVTQKEILTPSALWTWHGDDLHVSHYPIDKEQVVKTNRLNGTRGGRPKNKTKTKPTGFHSDNETDNPDETTRHDFAETEGNRKGKGMEGKGMEAETDAAATTTFSPSERILAESLVAAYPRKYNFGDSLRQAKACLLREADRTGDPQLAHDNILAGIEAIKDSIATWTDSEKMQFIKQPPAFFAQDHWKDDPTEWLSRRDKQRTEPLPPNALGGRKAATSLNL